MLGSIKYNLSHLLDFSGRDARPTFWFYLLFLFIVQIGIGMAVMIPIMASVMGAAFDATRNGVTDPAAMQAQIGARMAGSMGTMVWMSASMNALMTLLLMAAFVRRLHDSGKSGWWALLALAGQVAGIAVSIRMAGQMQAFMGQFSEPGHFEAILQRQTEMARYSLLGWIAPLTVIVFGTMKSTEGPNPYGEAPVSF
jgi:uncharacterized membrane protein YhaH (DUF805 family)